MISCFYIHTETGEQQEDETELQLLLEKEKKEEKAKLDEEFQKNTKEQTDLEQVVNTLVEYRKELQKQKDQLKHQHSETERKWVEFDKKLQSVKEETEIDKVKGFLVLKEIIMELKNCLRQRQAESEKLAQNSSKLMDNRNIVFNIVTERKTTVENNMEKIREQQQEIKNRRTDRELY